MVVERDPKRLAGLLDLAGHADIRLRRCRVARRVIVHENEGRGIQLQRPLGNLPGVDGNMVDRPLRLRLVRDQDVLAVEEENPELLRLAMCHRGVAVVQNRVPARDHVRLQDARPRHPVGGRLNHLQVGDHRVAHALHAPQPMCIGGQNPVEIAEGVQKPPRQRFHVLPGDRAKQKQLQKFVIRQRLGTALQEPLPQPRPVIGDIGGQPALR